MLGRSLGNYGVVSKIGEGGMGVVYLARHMTLGRPAAVKVLRASLSSNQDVVSRFFNEARAATAVRHPGIIEVYDFGFLDDRTAYIIMEYLEGESLASRMRCGRSTAAVTMAIVRAIARALQAVHERGIVHRDLKPDNVFLVPDPEAPGAERVKILDFGIAKLAAGMGLSSDTTTGTVLGTPTYMAPEQCSGERSVDHRADLYALGCIAYEMLCGRPPFTAEGAGDVMARHQYFEPCSLRSHGVDTTAEIDQLVLRLLKKRPSARYSTAAELVWVIDQLTIPTSTAVAVAGDTLSTLSATTKTTLSSAASSSDPPTEVSSRRFGLLAGAALAALAVLVVIFFLASAAKHRAAQPSGPRDTTPGTWPSDPGLVPMEDAAPPVPHAEPSRGQAPYTADRTNRALNIESTSCASDAPSATATPVALRDRDHAGGDHAGEQPSWHCDNGVGGSDLSVSAGTTDGLSKWIDRTIKHTTPGHSDQPLSPAVDEAPGAQRRSSPAPAVPSAPSDAACARAAFAAVLDARTPDATAIAHARSRLERCKPKLDRVFYEDLLRHLSSLADAPKSDDAPASGPLQLACAGAKYVIGGRRFRVWCEIGTTGGRTVDGMTYNATFDDGASVPVSGPTALSPRAGLSRFAIDLEAPAHVAAGPVQLTIVAGGPDLPQVRQTVAIEIIEARALCRPGEISIDDYRRKHRLLEDERAAGNITKAEFNDYLAELWSCVHAR